jgi:hypothetical protein
VSLSIGSSHGVAVKYVPYEVQIRESQETLYHPPPPLLLARHIHRPGACHHPVCPPLFHRLPSLPLVPLYPTNHIFPSRGARRRALPCGEVFSEFGLAAGDVQYINNLALFHVRNGFRDDDEHQ